MSQKDLLDQAFKKWIARLGLNWWDVEVHFYDDPGEIVRLFRQMDNGDVVPAFVDANWMYADAKISVNLPAFEDCEPDKIERIVVHELMHILVNEMREGELHHEERVVTQLTKALFWALDMAQETGVAPIENAYNDGFATGYEAAKRELDQPATTGPGHRDEALDRRVLFASLRTEPASSYDATDKRFDATDPAHGFYPGGVTELSAPPAANAAGAAFYRELSERQQASELTPPASAALIYKREPTPAEVAYAMELERELDAAPEPTTPRLSPEALSPLVPRRPKVSMERGE